MTHENREVIIVWRVVELKCVMQSGMDFLYVSSELSVYGFRATTWMLDLLRLRSVGWSVTQPQM